MAESVAHHAAEGRKRGGVWARDYKHHNAGPSEEAARFRFLESILGDHVAVNKMSVRILEQTDETFPTTERE